MGLGWVCRVLFRIAMYSLTWESFEGRLRVDLDDAESLIFATRYHLRSTCQIDYRPHVLSPK